MKMRTSMRRGWRGLRCAVLQNLIGSVAERCDEGATLSGNQGTTGVSLRCGDLYPGSDRRASSDAGPTAPTGLRPRVICGGAEPGMGASSVTAKISPQLYPRTGFSSSVSLAGAGPKNLKPKENTR